MRRRSCAHGENAQKGKSSAAAAKRAPRGGVNAAKIYLSRILPRLWPLKRPHRRPRFRNSPRDSPQRGARRSTATTRRSSSTARSTRSRRASRVRCFAHCGPQSLLRRAGLGLSCRNDDHEHRHQFRGRPRLDPSAPPASFRLRRFRRLPRAQVQSATTKITVSDGGKAKILVRDPRPSRPPARKRMHMKRRPEVRLMVEAPSPSSATART